jgi:hypothetical protein
VLMIFVGRFFEVLIGARPEPLWRLLSKVGILYALEPILTVIFVINLNTVWEKVMSTMRAQIFRRVLIQKVKFKLLFSLQYILLFCKLLFLTNSGVKTKLTNINSSRISIMKRYLEMLRQYSMLHSY